MSFARAYFPPHFSANMAMEIATDAQTVFDILRDYRMEHPAILPRPPFTGLEIEEGGLGDGTVIVVTMRSLLRERKLRGRVTEPEPGRDLRLVETYDVPTAGETTFTVQSLGERCFVSISTSGRTHRDGRLGLVERWFTERTLRRIYARELGLLRDRALRKCQNRA